MTSKQSWYAMKLKGAAGTDAEILIYEEIGYWGITAKNFADDLKALGDVRNIDLRINSPGGSVFDGIAIYNQLKRHKAQVTAYVDGLAASMASVIAMAGDLVVMPENSLMMIHNPWTVALGDAEELRKNADLLDQIRKAMLSAYTSKTGMSDEEVIAMMDEETWMTGADAVEMGFADETDEAMNIAASISNFQERLGRFQNLPNLSAVADVKPKKEGDMPNASTATDKVDIKKIEEDAVKAATEKEEARRKDIVSAFGDFADNHGELLNKCLLDSKCSAQDATQKLLNALGAAQKPHGGAVRTVDTGAAASFAAMADVLETRAGVKAKVEMENNPYRGSTLLEMAKASLEKRNIDLWNFSGKQQLVGAALTHTTSDFGNILKNVANKSMLRGYEEVQEIFSRFCSTGELPDFKQATRVDVNEAPSLRLVREGAEYKTITIGDRGETVQLATYGELFSITRQAIINDDLSAFTRIPLKLGRAARRTVGDLVFSILTSNPTMSDGTALFHANHNNLLTPGGLTVAGLSAGEAAMMKQKDASGNATLNIMPTYLLTPVALRQVAMTLAASEFDPAKTQRVPNPHRGRFEVLSDARLDVASAASWYLLASQGFDTIEVQYLDGIETPRMEEQAGWTVDGVEFKVSIDVGAKALDFRTMNKND